jgi:F0F1-type ATP synthase membrane subunit b/b'
MKSNVVTVTGELCSVKWKSMKERYNEINEKLKKVKEGTPSSNELIESIKSQNQLSKDKNDAIIAAAKAMEQASMACFHKFSEK